MAEQYLLSLGVFDGVFAVPNGIADRMGVVDPEFLPPILYLLRHSGQKIGCEEITRHTTVKDPRRVREILDFWAGEGLLRIETDCFMPDTSPRSPAFDAGAAGTIGGGRESGGTLFGTASENGSGQPLSANGSGERLTPGVEYGTPAGTAASAVPAFSAGAVSEGFTRSAPDAVESAAEPKKSGQVSSRPQKLAPGEVATRLEGDGELRFMVGKTEEILGRPLTSSDLSALISLVDWAGLSPDLVLMLVAHCRELGKVNMRYIERVGADWADRGIDSHEKAEALIRRQSEERIREQEVMSAFGLRDRALSEKEKQYIAQWYGDFGFDLRMIKLAFDRTVDRTGKLSFPYLHKILQSWAQKGFKEPKDALEEAQPQPLKPAAEKQESTMDFDLAERLLYE